MTDDKNSSRWRLENILLNLFVISLFIIFILHTIYGISFLLTSNLASWQIFIITLQIGFELVVFIQMSLIIKGISSLEYTADKFYNIKISEYPDLDVYIPIRRVNPDILEKTLIGIYDNNYPKEKLHVFTADDTPEEDLSARYKELSEKYGAKYIYDPSNIKFKAGMLNIALIYGKSKFVAFFDFDQIPQPGILHHFVEVLLSDKEVSFVQAKKTFIGLSNLSKVWSALLYAQYFEVFQRIKEKSKTVLFAGSTACFRRSDIDDLGGIPEDTFTEDNGLAVKLMLEGKFGKYTNFVGSVGTVPNKFSDQISQLWRWSHGASHVLRNNIYLIIRSKKMKLSQKFDLIGTLGIAPIVFFVYLYSFTFIPLILSGVDSGRITIFRIPSLVLVPLLTAITYVFIAAKAIALSKKDKESEFKFRHLPGFIIIGLCSNLLVFSSGITGIMGLLGPGSKRGIWNRNVKIEIIGLIGALLGIMLVMLSLIWYMNGYTSAILLFLIAITLLPGLPIVLYYNWFEKNIKN